MEILSKLSCDGEITFGCFIDGEVTDSRDYSNVIGSSRQAVDLWRKNTDRNSILFEVSKVLSANESVFQKIATLVNPEQRVHIKKQTEFVSEGFQFYSRIATKYDVDIFGESENGVPLACAILEDCPILPTLMWLTAAPLASGNTVVLFVKQSLSVLALCFAALLHEAGVPSGVVNVVPFVDGNLYPNIAPCFDRNVCVSNSMKLMVPNVFELLMREKSLSPILVLKSADIDSAIDCFLKISQNAMALWFPNAIFIEEPLYERFIQNLKFVATKYNAESAETDENQVKTNTTLNKFVNERKGQGYEVIEFKHAFFSCLTLINDDYALKMSTVIDENDTTHRLISVLPVRTANEGISTVNEKNGLAISLWSNDASEVISIPYKLKYGTVWVNCADRYSPTIPFSLWSNSGYGVFGGKQALRRHVQLRNSSHEEHELYSIGTNSTYHKKQITTVLKQSLDTQTQWRSLPIGDRLSFLVDVAKSMKINWNTYFRKVLEKTDESRWSTAIENVTFWSSYAIENNNEQMVLNKNHQVLQKSESLGVVGIITVSAPLDVLIFSICAAIAYGNTVVLGIPNDRKTSVVAAEIEKIFSSKSYLVSVIVSEEHSLWEQFITERTISSVWCVGKSEVPSELLFRAKNIFYIAEQSNMRPLAKFFEVHATKSKSVWYPCL